jgi:hypothetical protein
MVHYLAATLLAVTTFASTPTKVEWQADYGKALAATRSDQRPLLVVLDIPSNPQASLEGSLLATEGDQAKLLASYELCHVDVSTEYGKRVAQAFKATQFPHTTIIDRTGAVVLFKKPGQIAPTEWSATLTKYQTGEQATVQTVNYGSVLSSGYPTVSNPAYCPACQRKAMGL